MTFDAPGTSPSIVYPLPGGGDIPAFPPGAAGTPGGSTAAAEAVETVNAAEAVEAAGEEDPTKAPLFSRIFYEKGASVNRMVATHLGWDAWDASLGRQVNAHLWSNPTVEDLMRSLDPAFEAAGSPPAMDAMLPWLQRPGFPVVTLVVKQEQQGGAVVATLHASQAPISPFLPPARAAEPWWIPLRVSCDGGAPFLFEFNTTIASMAVPMKRSEGSGADNGRTANTTMTCVGDPQFRGFFSVRYAQDSQWAARIAGAAASLTSTPDYTRALAFHTFIMATMAHEPASIPARLLTALAPALAQNKRLGGYAGSGDLYTMLLTRAAPVTAVLDAGGATSAAAAGEFRAAVRALVGPLANWLGWEEEVETEKTRMAAVTGPEPTTPWPQHEDAGVEARAHTSVRPMALLRAVLSDDTATVASALVQFRAHYAGPAARATYFAAARYGQASDKAALRTMLTDAVSAGKPYADLLFGLSAGAGDAAGCAAGLAAVSTSTSAAGAGAAVAALTDVLQHAPACRAAAWAYFEAAAGQYWKADGAAATSAITKAFAWLVTAPELASAASLLATQNATVASAAARHTALTQIKININMVANNAGERQ